METCRRCNRDVKDFPITKYGRPSTMCSACYEDTMKRNALKHQVALQKRAEASPDIAVCMRCKKEKPICEFDTNGKLRRRILRGERSMQCEDCREYATRKARDYRAAHPPDKKASILTLRRDYMRKFRDLILAAYGATCKCCGETRPEFLALDHVNNDGAKHRKVIGFNSESLYRWAKKNNFPDTLQVLCHNCNLAKAFYGACPHERL